MIPLSDCTFHVEANNKGQFIGRCRDYPDIRTRPYKSRLDAIKEIVDLVAEKIRYRDESAEIIRRGY